MSINKVIKHIVVLVHPYSTLLNVSAPIEVFQTAIDEIEKTNTIENFKYKIHIVSASLSKKISMHPGIFLECESNYLEIDYPIDTLLVAGAPREIGYPKDILHWIKSLENKVRRICSMCAGAFILAEAELLNNKKAVTHWLLCDKLSDNYPEIDVDKDAIFVKYGNIYTSAGVSAGLDLSLALIEEDLGKTFALRIAKLLVVFLKRPGNQTQYSTMLESQNTDYQPISQIIDWMKNNLAQEMTVEKLAEKSSMSPRNFARVFVRELKTTPIKYLEKIRIETACRFLIDSNLTIEEIAALTGFKTSLNLNRIFLKNFNTTTSQYRNNFGSIFSSPNKF